MHKMLLVLKSSLISRWAVRDIASADGGQSETSDVHWPGGYIYTPELTKALCFGGLFLKGKGYYRKVLYCPLYITGSSSALCLPARGCSDSAVVCLFLWVSPWSGHAQPHHFWVNKILWRIVQITLYQAFRPWLALESSYSSYQVSRVFCQTSLFLVASRTFPSILASSMGFFILASSSGCSPRLKSRVCFPNSLISPWTTHYLSPTLHVLYLEYWLTRLPGTSSFTRLPHLWAPSSRLLMLEDLLNQSL